MFEGVARPYLRLPPRELEELLREELEELLRELLENPDERLDELPLLRRLLLLLLREEELLLRVAELLELLELLEREVETELFDLFEELLELEVIELLLEVLSTRTAPERDEELLVPDEELPRRVVPLRLSLSELPLVGVRVVAPPLPLSTLVFAMVAPPLPAETLGVPLGRAEVTVEPGRADVPPLLPLLTVVPPLPVEMLLPEIWVAPLSLVRLPPRRSL